MDTDDDDRDQQFDIEEEEDEEIDDDNDSVDDSNRAMNLEAFECPLREWINEERTRREIQRRFRDFLKTFYVGIEDVNRFRRWSETVDPRPPLPAHLKVTPPIYPIKIR